MAKSARRPTAQPADKKTSAKRAGVPSKTAKNVVHIDGRDRRPWALVSKDRLLEAATEEIAAVGFERARLAEIAERAEMTPGSVYTWFANKEELFRAALEHALSAQIRSNAEFMDSSGLTGSDWMLKVAATVPRNAGDSGPTSAQQLLIEAYYASWRDPAACEILRPAFASTTPCTDASSTMRRPTVRFRRTSMRTLSRLFFSRCRSGCRSSRWRASKDPTT